MISKMIQALERDGVVEHARRAELAKLERGAITVINAGGSYFAPKTPLNPCEGCVDLVARITPRADVFQRGRELELGGSTHGLAEVKPGWLARLRDRMRGPS
jgi:hypothetical protein